MYKKKKKKVSISWFRSKDLRVMSPASFPCAKMLILVYDDWG